MIGQDPKPGTEVPARSATTVNLIVAARGTGSGDSSSGGGRADPGGKIGGADLSRRLSVAVPDVRNRTLKEASRILADAGLGYTVVSGDSDTVRAQSPEPGASVRRGIPP